MDKYVDDELEKLLITLAVKIESVRGNQPKIDLTIDEAKAKLLAWRSRDVGGATSYSCYLGCGSFMSLSALERHIRQFHEQAEAVEHANYVHIEPDSYMCLNYHAVTHETADNTPWMCGDPTCDYYDGVAPTPQLAEFRSEEHQLEATAMNIVHQIGDALYDALPKDVAHKYFVDARQATNDIAIDFAKKLITQATERAEVEGRISELSKLDGNFGAIYSHGDGNDRTIEQRKMELEERLYTLTTLDKEKKS